MACWSCSTRRCRRTRTWDGRSSRRSSARGGRRGGGRGGGGRRGGVRGGAAAPGGARAGEGRRGGGGRVVARGPRVVRGREREGAQVQGWRGARAVVERGPRAADGVLRAALSELPRPAVLLVASGSSPLESVLSQGPSRC